MSVQEFENHLYLFEARDAVSHIFRVASSLDSMVVGEPQILGQVKSCYQSAVANRNTGVILNKLLHKTFSVAKRVRTETAVASHAVSISYAAVELARKIFGDLAGLKILLVGAGDMAELAAEHLLSNHARELVVANRSLERAMDLAQRYHGRAARLEELPALLVDADIVISSTGADSTIVSAETVRSVLRPRRHRPLFFIDIAVPRDIDPEVNHLGNVYLYDIDDLESVIHENRQARAEEAIRAERIVEEESLKFMKWMETLAVTPTIVAIRDKAEAIRSAELQRSLSRFDSLTEDQIEALETLTRSLVHKIMHDPIMFIKNAGHRNRKDLYLEVTRKLFNIDEAGSGDSPRDTGDDDSGS